MTENIVEQLLLGSREIDRMRQEINVVVQMICGFIQKELFPESDSYSSYTYRQTHKLEKCGIIRWEIWVRSNEKHQVYAFVNHPAGSCGSGVLDTIPLHYVQSVRNSLDGFVNEATRIFPGIRWRMQPLLDVNK